MRPERDDWVERALSHYERPEVAATNGQLHRWDGRPLLEPVDQTLAVLRCAPGWGFSNHAASWRASVWRGPPFDEAMEACEDKEWAARVLRGGRVVVFDPLLHVDGRHRKAAGTRALFDRTRREARAIAAAGLVPEFPAARRGARVVGRAAGGVDEPVRLPPGQLAADGRHRRPLHRRPGGPSPPSAAGPPATHGTPAEAR